MATKTAKKIATTAVGTPDKAVVTFKAKQKPRFNPGDYVTRNDDATPSRVWYVHGIRVEKGKNGCYYVYELHSPTLKLNAFGYHGSQYDEVRGSVLAKSKEHKSPYEQAVTAPKKTAAKKATAAKPAKPAKSTAARVAKKTTRV